MSYIFSVYGKKNCGICKNRVDFFEKFINKHGITGSIEYKEVDDPDILSEIAVLNCLEGLNLDIEKIPIVIMKDKEDNILKTWNGYDKENLPTTPQVLKIIKEGS